MRARKFIFVGFLVLVAVAACRPEVSVAPEAVPVPQTGYVPQANEVYVRQDLPPVIADDTSTLTVAFPLRNDGTAPITFTGVRKSCGCSDAELAKTSLQPGEETTLNVAVRTPGRFGQQRITCYVDDSSGKTWVCDLHTTIHQRLRFDPLATHFGLIRPRSEHTRNVTFLACATTEAELPSRVVFKCDSPNVTLGEVREEVERPASGVVLKRVTVSVKLVAPSVLGPNSATLTATLPDGKTTLTTSVDWHVPETFVVTPRQVFFSANEAKTGGTKQVLIRRRDGERMTALTVKSPHPAVGVTTTADTDLTTLTVTFDGSKGGEFVHGELVITTGDADQPTVRIPVAVGR
jgi:hypothetical protein